MPGCGHAERALQASWWQEHGAAHAGGPRAQQAGKLETRTLFAGSQGGTVAPAGGNTCAPRSARLVTIIRQSVPNGGTLLARMARFIVADLTDLSSIPKELEATSLTLPCPFNPCSRVRHGPMRCSGLLEVRLGASGLPIRGT